MDCNATKTINKLDNKIASLSHELEEKILEKVSSYLSTLVEPIMVENNKLKNDIIVTSTFLQEVALIFTDVRREVIDMKHFVNKIDEASVFLTGQVKVLSEANDTTRKEVTNLRREIDSLKAYGIHGTWWRSHLLYRC